MKIVWSTLWFLDYRIAVFAELSRIPGVELFLIYNKDVNSENINNKVKTTLSDHAISLSGEIRLGSDSVSGFANKGFRIPYQPGLVRKIRSLKPDVMISDGFFQWTYAPLFLNATKHIPHVMCYERTSHTERNVQLIRKLYRKLVLNYIDVICCSGKLCGDYIAKLGCDVNKITFGHMAADVENLRNQVLIKDKSTSENLKQKTGLSGIVYLFVGQMINRKGIINLLKAWKDFTSVLTEKPSLLLVGSGDQDQLIKEEIINNRLNTVKFAGRVNYDDIAAYYQLADIFIMPTLEDNWSLVVPEAMSCGLPIITSVFNGCWPELVQKSNGWVMDPLNHNEFVDILLESYKRRNEFKTMGQASFKIVQNFTPASAAKNIYDSCQKAIKLKKKWIF